MMKNKSIKNLNDLRQYQEILKLKLDSSNNQLAQSWTYIKTNSFKLVWREINPFKGNKGVNMVLDLIQPGLLPVIAEVAKGSVKGNPLNLKVLGSTLKYAAAQFGIKWLRKLLDSKPEETVEQEEAIPSEEEKA
jgi:hypothetical protein